jgi:hypothetical protein
LFKKYTIAGENNPVWQVVEPLILNTWAKGMLQASTTTLFTVHFMMLIMGSVFFLTGFIVRLFIMAIVLIAIYAIIPGPFSLSFAAIFPAAGLDFRADTGGNWILLYQLLGYVVLIKSVLFLFGKNFNSWLFETIFYLLLMVTGMLPLRWIATGVIDEKYFVQGFLKTHYMGGYIVKSINAAPPFIQKNYDELFELYMDSNSEESRKKLEDLCAIADHV